MSKILEIQNIKPAETHSTSSSFHSPRLLTSRPPHTLAYSYSRVHSLTLFRGVSPVYLSMYDTQVHRWRSRYFEIDKYIYIYIYSINNTPETEPSNTPIEKQRKPKRERKREEKGRNAENWTYCCNFRSAASGDGFILLERGINPSPVTHFVE